MRRHDYPPPNLSGFREFMRSIGYADREESGWSEAAMDRLTADLAHLRREPDLLERLHTATVDAAMWQRRYRGFRARALLMLGALAALALVGWLR